MDNNQVIHPIDSFTKVQEPTIMPQNLVPKKTTTMILSVILILGVATGTTVSFLGGKNTTTKSDVKMIQNVGPNSKSAGVLDKKTFTDSATGVLRDGGMEGEGSHHLERGAKDQTAYLTSSTIDLSPFVGKKVVVWGQTYSSQKVSWFMDVGYIELAK